MGVDADGNRAVLVDKDYAAGGGHLILGNSATLSLPTSRPQPISPRPADEIENDARKKRLLAHLTDPVTAI